MPALRWGSQKYAYLPATSNFLVKVAPSSTCSAYADDPLCTAGFYDRRVAWTNRELNDLFEPSRPELPYDSSRSSRRPQRHAYRTGNCGTYPIDWDGG